MASLSSDVSVLEESSVELRCLELHMPGSLRPGTWSLLVERSLRRWCNRSVWSYRQ
ncbi:hypothetical protein [Paludibaculum fermentans]|uniref:Uncharacterized protein n=1 Tax=Paludibaculum fermentans TaxID=1473598 RepID=A0A7S7NUR9_PALFE|nr:hypothetical protein [Paludibaculum fermentans]QOY90162.1 hypothetical protein IRI77_09475 [Paludibaculum fermentans]